MNALQSLTINKTAGAVPRVKLLIGGEWVDSQTNEWRDIVNPATQEVLAQVPFATEAEVDAALQIIPTAVARLRELSPSWKKATTLVPA